MTVWRVRPAVGTRVSERVAPLTRAHIAQYAGASGDFNLVHVDEPFAVEVAGRPGVIAHGMLTMGLAGTLVHRLVGPRALRRFGGRFLAAVHPGDVLELSAEVREVRSVEGGWIGEVAVDVARPHDGRVVFRGSASVEVAPDPR